MIEPARLLNQPAGSADVMCRANAPVTGDFVPSARSGTSSRPSSSMNRAPWWPSSPGWNMNSTRPAMSARASGEQLGRAGEHRRVGVVPAGVHRPVRPRGEVETGVLVQRQRVHVAAQQHGRARACRRSAGRRCRSSSRARSRRAGSPSSAASTVSWVTGSSLPTSGHWCRVRRSSMVGVRRSLASSRASGRARWSIGPWAGHGIVRRARRGPCERSVPGRRAGRHRRRARSRRHDRHPPGGCAPSGCDTAPCSSP